MDKDKETRGVIFNIQTYSIHDGPGIRTEVLASLPGRGYQTIRREVMDKS
jgi:hypothetical protein